MTERQTVYIVKGGHSGVSGIYPSNPPEGTTEWQMSDGPAGHRGSSSDFLDLEDALADNGDAVFNVDDADFTPEEFAVYDQFVSWRGW